MKLITLAFVSVHQIKSWPTFTFWKNVKPFVLEPAEMFTFLLTTCIVNVGQSYHFM